MCPRLKLGKLLCTFFCNGHTDVLLFVVVEVARISRASAFRNKRRLHLRVEENKTNKDTVSVIFYHIKDITLTMTALMMMMMMMTPHLSLIDGDPIRRSEPFVVFDVVDAILEVAVPLGQVDLKQIP